MSHIMKIELIIQTDGHEDAGTDGSVYLGICGREFRCDTSSDDFERDSVKTYIFGRDRNVSKAPANDPRDPAIQESELELFPVYLRFDQGTSDHWALRRASLHINEEIAPRYERMIVGAPLWLGANAGAFCHLMKHHDGPFATVTAAEPDQRKLR